MIYLCFKALGGDYMDMKLVIFNVGNEALVFLGRDGVKMKGEHIGVD